jgi:hypothetical protein
LLLHEGVSHGWPFRSFELVLFLGLAGTALDVATIRRLDGTWRQLPDYYEITRVKAVVAYAKPTALALIGIGQQITSGHAQSAIVEIIKSFTTVVPS